MTAAILEILSAAFVLAGSAFMVAGAVGLVRMPDLFTRMQAASVIETMGAGLILVGFMLQAGFSLVTLKLAFLVALLFYIGPVIAHALAQAALHEGVKPILSENRSDKLHRKDH